ncbi:hypothetical protein FQN54_004538 [Arachnomyces sp. PD_36]|nr:hypothetical protein FQN54_004538 [Arachnomyces sp. PD_36]
MSRIEELPDDFDESLDLNKPPSGAPSIPPEAFLNSIPFPIKDNGVEKDPTMPDMPPSMASVKSHTGDEIIDLMNKTPLFMTDMEKATEGDEENIQLEALRALQNEGTRSEVVQNFREQGNECARAKQWKDGKEFYNKAIAVLNAKEDKWDKPDDVNHEQRQLRMFGEACYINRALCNLELKNYRSTTLDCASALKYNPKNVKAYYRSSLALLALDKIAQAEDTCARGLQLDPSNKPLQTVSSKVADRKAVVERIAAKKRKEEEELRKKKFLLNAALKAREIKVRKTEQPPDMEDASIHLSPDPLSPESTLVFPAVFLYPMDAQSDFIKAFSEMNTIADHLDYIFPLPWDTKKEYTIGSVDCYMETTAGGLIKAGKKLPLLKLLTGGKVEVVDEIVKINVVPTSKAGIWIEEMKKKKAKSG